jgi:hypothetical protein
MIPIFPVLIFMVGSIGGFLSSWVEVLTGRKAWVGYWVTNQESISGLPPIRSGVIHHAVQYAAGETNDEDVRKLNYLYAKHYAVSDDLNVLLKNISALGK